MARPITLTARRSWGQGPAAQTSPAGERAIWPGQRAPDTGGAAERLLDSFVLTLEQDEWRSAL